MITKNRKEFKKIVGCVCLAYIGLIWQSHGMEDKEARAQTDYFERVRAWDQLDDSLKNKLSPKWLVKPQAERTFSLKKTPESQTDIVDRGNKRHFATRKWQNHAATELPTQQIKVSLPVKEGIKNLPVGIHQETKPDEETSSDNDRNLGLEAK